jgi:two-component sensor histidine kinase
MVETIPLAIHLTSGTEHRTEYINPAMVGLFGYTQQELPTIEQWWPLAYPEEHYRRQIAEEWSSRLQQAIQTQKPIQPMDVVVSCKDGSKKNITWGYITLGDKNYAFGLDLTKRKHAEAALRESLDENQTLLKEIHFRVNHNLQIICSLLRLPTSLIDQPVASIALKNMQNRVLSMALVHEHFYRSDNLAHMNLATYIRCLCDHLLASLVPTPRTIQVQLDLLPVHLTIEQAIPFGLLINELVSNALIHGFPGGLTGELRVDLRSISGGREMRLRVTDNGVGLPPNFDLKLLTSLGLPLAADLACQLGGRLQIGKGPGTVLEMLFRESRL